MGDDEPQGQVGHSGDSSICLSLSTSGRAGARRFPRAGPFGPKHGLRYLDTDYNSGENSPILENGVHLRDVGISCDELVATKYQAL